MEQLIIHYSYEGNLIPIDSEEAKSYLQREKFVCINNYKILTKDCI